MEPNHRAFYSQVIQKKNNVFDLIWNDSGAKYKDVFYQAEKEFSEYNFEHANIEFLFKIFEMSKTECKSLLEKKLSLPAYDQCLKASHVFNLLDARGAISVTERTGFIGRVRNLARLCAEGYVRQRENMKFPLLDKKS